MRIPVRAALSLALVLFFQGTQTTSAADTGFGRDTLTIISSGESYLFDVEVALTSEQQQLGLMHRTYLPPDAGMLFLYRPPQRIRMWMKNTFVSLDMLFVKGDGRIVSIAERTVPLSLTPIGPDVYVSGVVEVLSGTVERLNLQLGDRVLHPYFGNDRNDG